MKKRYPKKVTLENLKQYAFKYMEKFSSTENQLRIILKRKIIKTSFFYKTDPQNEFIFIDDIIKNFKNIGLIDDKKLSDIRSLNLIKRGFSKKKIFSNLRAKGFETEVIEKSLTNLEKFFSDYELAAALIYAKKKKLLFINKNLKDYETKKILVQMSRGGFNYDIAKKILNIKNEKEFMELEDYANNVKN